ncbi:MAG: diaminopimelate decarboxylase [Alphaproteobacteria bacterium]|nr:diaminopimelate decarboxylase [Alphaproteobacteria bacterium]
MDHFNHRGGELFAEDVPVARIAAEVGTPFYCYSDATLRRHYRVLKEALAGAPGSICYAVKANSNLAVLRTLGEMGAGADVVSEGELRRALAAGIPPERVIFEGPGKTRAEMAFALTAGIDQFNIESDAELVALDDVARGWGKVANIAVRINPNVDAHSLDGISTGRKRDKFGILWPAARATYRVAAGLASVKVAGVAMHIGSQITDTLPFERAFRVVAEIVETLRADGHDIRRLDLGGGLGVPYTDERPPSPAEYARAVLRETQNLGCELVFQPGRMLVANAGILVTRVTYEKDAAGVRMVIVDAGMNDLVRPAMYKAKHTIVPVRTDGAQGPVKPTPADVVGPICETSDTFAKDWPLPPTAPGDLLAIRTAGAYGAVMASNYNTRPLVPEVMVRGNEFAVVRPRQTYESLLAGETLPPWLTGGGGVG